MCLPPLLLWKTFWVCCYWPWNLFWPMGVIRLYEELWILCALVSMVLIHQWSTLAFTVLSPFTPIKHNLSKPETELEGSVALDQQASVDLQTCEHWNECVLLLGVVFTRVLMTRAGEHNWSCTRRLFSCSAVMTRATLNMSLCFSERCRYSRFTEEVSPLGLSSSSNKLYTAVKWQNYNLDMGLSDAKDTILLIAELHTFP